MEKAPKTSDRKLVESGEISIYSFPESIGCRLPDDPDEEPIFLSERDVKIVLRLSDELHLNEIDCVRLILTAEEVYFDDADEKLQFVTHLWYTERRDLLAALNTLLWAAVRDPLPGLGFRLIKSDTQKYLKFLINKGLRQRLILLIKELKREESALMGRPHSDIPSSNHVRELRKDMVSQEMLILGHCLVLSVLVTLPSPRDVKDIFSILKDNAKLTKTSDTVERQIMCGLVIALVSNAQSASHEKASVLFPDDSFLCEFHENVMAAVNDSNVEGFDGIMG